MTPVQMFRDRWECGHIGTVIFVVQAVLLVPYIIIGIMGGGTTLHAISGGLVPFWFGGAIVAMVVMSYVFFGGMRGTAWVNTFQTVLFLLFGAVALIVIGAGMGGFRNAAQAMLSAPAFAPLLTRERISPLYFFSYTFIPLSAIAFPHILIFCLTARKMGQFKKTVIFYPTLHPGDLAALRVSRRDGEPRDRCAGDSREAGSAARVGDAGEKHGARAARRIT